MLGTQNVYENDDKQLSKIQDQLGTKGGIESTGSSFVANSHYLGGFEKSWWPGCTPDPLNWNQEEKEELRHQYVLS